MSWGAIVVGAVGAGVSIYNSSKNRERAEEQAEEAKTEQKKQQKLLAAAKQEYKSMEYTNPFANMENMFEDLTVNQQQAQFEAQQGAQQRTNIMQSLKGAAGGSGIAGLAQMMSQQGQLQTQQASASIGMQEAANQKLAAKGAMQADVTERQGEQWVQQQQINKQETLLGMQMAEASGANEAAQQGIANEEAARIAQQQATADIFSVGGKLAGAGTDALGDYLKNRPGK